MGWLTRLGLVVALVAGCGSPSPTGAPTAPSAAPTTSPGTTTRGEPTAGASTSSSSEPTEPTAWTFASPAPLALTEVGATAHLGRIWVAGGLDAQGAATDRVFVYDPASDTWSEGPRLPEPIHHSSLVSDGTSLYLVGGYVGNDFGSPTDAVRVLADPAGSWADHSRLPERRGAGAAAWDGTRLVYAGGVGDGGVSPTVFATRDGAWAPIGRLSQAREHLAAASTDSGTVFVLGGRNGGLEGNLGRVDVVAGDRLFPVGDLPTPRGGVAAFWWPSIGACLIGGESPGGTNTQVECMDESGRVTVLPELGAPRHGLGAAVLDGRVYALLGGPQPGLFVSGDVEVLDLSD